MALHDNEISIDENGVRSLLEEQCPQWARLPLSLAGAGTDNHMYRLGDDLVVRLPRTAETARSLQKEHTWLPRLAPLLTCKVPEPVYAGVPSSDFPLDWSVFRWIGGEVAAPDTVTDWAGLGTDIAEFVRELHGTDLMGAARGDFGSNRARRTQGGRRHGHVVKQVKQNFDNCRTIIGTELDLDALEQIWLASLSLPEPSGAQVWRHNDLKPANLLVQDGKLHAVIDFGASLPSGFRNRSMTPSGRAQPRHDRHTGMLLISMT
jgi:aminoglycoside phosphotransferase (APT) family kinase protein